LAKPVVVGAPQLVIIGGGIVGLATAALLSELYPHLRLSVLEKELALAQHQTGRNSGVIHSGIYYKPGSFKARFARAGSHSMVAFCKRHGLPVKVCGKVIVATNKAELPRLETLYQRGLENGLTLRRLDKAGVCELEPHVQAVAGLHVASTGITDYKAVCQKLADITLQAGNSIQFGCEVKAIRETSQGYVLETNQGVTETQYLINCAGLHSDRIAKAGGANLDAAIIPFRGEYYHLKKDKAHLVKALIYPVPNPDFPFLGVHFTRMIDGSIHAGPNAVPSLAREGYFKTDMNLRDSFETFTHPGFWRLAAKHAGEGAKEIWRSLSKAAFVKSLQALIPEITADDIEPSPAGVRAQALTKDGKLVDDFWIVEKARALHVCNAPSPAATSSLEIAKEIVRRLPESLVAGQARIQTLQPGFATKNTEVNA
jgi:L-2-hydroxyglutarate oxidase